jgi:acyl-CoA thioester hydrolase
LKVILVEQCPVLSELVRGNFLTFDQVVFSGGTCVASAQSVTVLIDESTRKPTPLTGEIIGNFQRWLRRGVDGA